jgi:hypothetical protein
MMWPSMITSFANTRQCGIHHIFDVVGGTVGFLLHTVKQLPAESR